MDIIDRIKALKPAKKTIKISLAEKQIADYQRQVEFSSRKIGSLFDASTCVTNRR